MRKNIANYIDESIKSINETSTFDQNFEYVGREELLRGVYYHETERSVIYLHRHESFEDIINTCVHETIHHCVNMIVQEEADEGGGLRIDGEQEHDIIRNMAWANYWGVDGFTQISGKMYPSKITILEEEKIYKQLNKNFVEEEWL